MAVHWGIMATRKYFFLTVSKEGKRERDLREKQNYLRFFQGKITVGKVGLSGLRGIATAAWGSALVSVALTLLIILGGRGGT